MPIYKPKVPVMAAIACSGVALIFQLVAVAGTGWITSSGGDMGLFRFCVYTPPFNIYVCARFTDATDYWLACQVFSLLGEGTIFASFVIGVLHLFREDTTRLTVPVTALSAVSVAILVVEVGVFAGKTSAVYAITPTYGYGFYLSIAAAVLSLVSTILHAVGRFASQ
ncbi:uncharacterized protein LOC112562962 [Pomacea canaliculata]|uniref:uncharacterized protein LOC112562962 n=1 Tax=Pomacea canaliculata TaxID=400727 RepID=UPI000D72603C|nr:uncharacterized protein LOC112562962 [Pomacea canaliculata]